MEKEENEVEATDESSPTPDLDVTLPSGTKIKVDLDPQEWKIVGLIVLLVCSILGYLGHGGV